MSFIKDDTVTKRQDHTIILNAWQHDKKGCKTFKEFKNLYGVATLAVADAIRQIKVHGKQPKSSGWKILPDKAVDSIAEGRRKMGRSRIARFKLLKGGKLKDWIISMFKIHGPTIGVEQLFSFARRTNKKLTPAIVNKSISMMEKSGQYRFKRTRSSNNRWWKLTMIVNGGFGGPAVDAFKKFQQRRDKLVARTPNTEKKPARVNIDLWLEGADFDALDVLGRANSMSIQDVICRFVSERLVGIRENIKALDIGMITTPESSFNPFGRY